MAVMEMSAVPKRDPLPRRNPIEAPIYVLGVVLSVLAVLPLVGLAIVALAPNPFWAPVIAFSAPLGAASILLAAYILRPLFGLRSAADTRRRQR